MRLWESGSAAFFIYVIAVALLLPRLEAAARWRGALAGTAGLLAAFASSWIAPRPLLHEWVIPLGLLLLAYWSSGALFVAPMPRAERLLEGIDARLGILRIAGRLPRPAAEFLELAYVSVSPILPIAFALHLYLTPNPSPERFWAVMLLTDFLCFGMLPWIQTRPPRAIEEGAPWRSSVRTVNERLLGTVGIHVNTFPSGHAAEALAAVLLVTAAPVPVAVGMLVVAVSITAGAVLGRYHYALDALTGWIVALLVWLVVGLR